MTIERRCEEIEKSIQLLRIRIALFTQNWDEYHQTVKELRPLVMKHRQEDYEAYLRKVEANEKLPQAEN